jgi:large subunit ribosomal protein L13
VDCGDYVVVTNAKNIKVTGRKDEQLVYRKHTMFPGGLKETEYKDMMENKPYEVGLDLMVQRTQLAYRALMLM